MNFSEGICIGEFSAAVCEILHLLTIEGGQYAEENAADWETKET